MIRKPPWPILNRLPGQKGVKADWDGFPDSLLKPTQEPAHTFPCPKKRGCVMDVIRRPDGSIVGICQNESDGCDKRALQKTDVIVYRPSFSSLFTALGQPFGVNTAEKSGIDGVPHGWKIGDFNPAASYRFPVLALIEGRKTAIERAINLFAVRFERPFFLLLPDAATITQAAHDLARHNKARLLAFEDIIEITGSGAIRARQGIETIIQETAQSWIGTLDGATGEFRFPTPAGAVWGGFVFEFTAAEKVSVSYKKELFKIISPEDLGMRNKNTKKPTKAWAFLQALAKVNGQMADVQEPKQVAPTKKAVSQALKSAFQLDDDPIEWSYELRGYQAKFAIRKTGRF